MKRTFLMVAICLFSVLGFAQTDESGKEKVYIDYFSYPSRVGSALAEALRSKVIEGIQAMDRVILIDVGSNEVLKEEAKRRQEASAMGDATARSEQMTTLGAKYLIQGFIASMQAVKKSYSDGRIYYEGSISYTLKVVDPSNGSLKTTKSFSHGGTLTETFTGDTPQEAILKTFKEIKLDMDNLINESFKLEGTIVQIESVKNDKAVTVYIDLGSKQGIQKGQQFLVFAEVDAAGVLSRKEIGRLDVKEVMGETRSLCKVGKGDKEIFEAEKNGKKLFVERKKEGKDILKTAGGILGI